LWNGEYRKWLRRNIYILSDSQAVIKGFYSFHINSELFGDCHQSPVKLAELNRIQWVWVPGHMGIDGNFIVYQLARQVPHIHLQDPSLPLAYLQRLSGWDRQKT
jgi:ribonuclease HI